MLPDERWDANMVRHIKGYPWKPEGGDEEPITVTGEVPRAAPEPIWEEKVNRAYIMKSDIVKYGATKGCPGCRAAVLGERARTHSEQCRARMEQLMKEDSKDNERLKEAEKRKERADTRRREEVDKRARIGNTRTGLDGAQEATAPAQEAAAAAAGAASSSNSPATDLTDDPRSQVGARDIRDEHGKKRRAEETARLEAQAEKFLRRMARESGKRKAEGRLRKARSNPEQLNLAMHNGPCQQQSSTRRRLQM